MNVKTEINKLPGEEMKKFLELVDDYSNDGSWCRENHVHYDPSNRKKVAEILYQQIYPN